MRKYSLIISVLLLKACSPGVSDFQRFKPENPVNLRRMLDEIPAIVSLFDNVDPGEINRRTGKLAESQVTHIVKSLMVWSEITREPMPRLIDVLAAAVHDTYGLYRANPGEFNQAFNIGLSLLNTKKEGVIEPSSRVSDFVRYVAASADLFGAAAGTEPFPAKSVWFDCESDNFSNALPAPADKGRKTLLGIYKGLRVVYCVFKDGHGTPGADPGEYFYNYLVYDRANHPNIEQRMYERIQYLRTHAAEIQELEEGLTEWLVKNPDKKFITDFLTDDAFRLLKKNATFTELGRIADLEAAHLTLKDPDQPTAFMAKWFMDGLSADADKFAKPEQNIELEFSGNSLIDFINGFFNSSSASVKSAITRYGNGSSAAGKNKLLDLFWDGSVFTNTFGNSFNFPGVLNPIPGTIINTVSNEYSHFRLQMHDLLNGDGDGNYYYSAFNASGSADTADGNPLNPSTGLRKRISPTYKGETFMQAAMTNFYLHILENYYSPVQKKWALDLPDSQNYFSSPDRNLSSLLAKWQYGLRNAVVMDSMGRNPGEPGFSNISFISSLLYAQAIQSGVVNPTAVPEVATLKAGLTNQNSPLKTNGIADGLANVDIRIFCNNGSCGSSSGFQDQTQMRIYRNGHRIRPDLMSHTLQFVSPGIFQERMGQNASDPWHLEEGLTPEQADLKNSGGKMSVWIQSLVAMHGWLGHGPYTYRGKAPNGSKHKYRNDYYTDRYRSEIYAKFCWGLCGTPDFWPVSVPLGNNGGACEGHDDRDAYNDHYNAGSYPTTNAQNDNPAWAASSSTRIRCVGSPKNTEGNYHIYENIYVPQAPSDPCWTASLGGGSYPRYGFKRPSKNNTYANNANCAGWQQVQIDMPNRDEAIRANFEWLMRHKKLVLVVPVTGEEYTGLGTPMLANWMMVMGNGLLGIVNVRFATNSVSDDPRNANGRWNSDPAYNMLNADTGSSTASNNVQFYSGATGLVENSSNGLTSETPGGGAGLTRRFGRTSFEPEDSSVFLDMTMRLTGIAGGVTNIYDQIWSKLSAGYLQAPLLRLNAHVYSTLGTAEYALADIVTGGATSSSLAKFRPFYDRYFPEDLNSNGVADLYEDYLAGKIKASEMPPVPRVTGVTYPASFNAAGAVASWYTHTGESEGKLSALVTPIAMVLGTALEGSGVKPPSGTYATTGANTDNIAIQHYHEAGFRQNMDSGQLKLIALAETDRAAPSDAPAYNTRSIVNNLIETAPGLKNGPIPKLATSRYFNAAISRALRDDFTKFCNDSVKKSFSNFTLLTSLNAGSVSNLDRLRYFFTGNAVGAGNPFTTNYLGNIGGDTTDMVKMFFAYMRSLGSDPETVAILKNLVKTINKFSAVNGSAAFVDLEDTKLDDLLQLFNAKNSDGNYVMDAVVDFMKENNLNDFKTFTNLKFTNLDTFLSDLKKVFDDLNKELIAIHGPQKDLRRKFLLGKLIDEPYYDTNGNGIYDTGEPYFDFNANGSFDRGFFSFRAFYTTDPAGLVAETFTDTTNVGGSFIVQTKIPDFFNLHGYDWRFYTPGETVELTRSELDTTITDVQAMNFNAELTGAKNDLIHRAFDEQYFDEPWKDKNSNGVVDAGEYADVNNNGRYDTKAFQGETFTDSNANGYYDSGEPFTDSIPFNGKYDGPISLRSLVRYYGTAYKDKYNELNSEGTVNFGLNLANDLLNPRCSVSSATGSAECVAQNPDYLTAALGSARQLFNQHVVFNPSDLKALKNVAGNFLYRRDVNGYQYALTNGADRLVPIMQLNVGNFAENRDSLISSLEKDTGSMRYVLKQMRLAERFKAVDVLKDFDTLMGMKVMREYNHKGTFWYQLSEVLTDYSSLAYEQKKMGFNLNPDYYGRFRNLFNR